MTKNNLLYKFAALAFVLLLSLPVQLLAQDETTESDNNRPVRPAFESGLLFDAATTTLQPAKSLEMVLQHRFGVIDNGIHDFFGIWGASNIRLGLNYSPLNNLTVGIGATKANKMEDLQIKYRAIEQTRSNSVPVTVVLLESIGLDGSPSTKWDTNYAFGNRFSYFTQVIVSRRFNDHLSLQIAPGFTHYNSLDSIYDHDRFSLSFAGRYKFTPQGSFIISGDFPLRLQGISEHSKAYNEANMALMAQPNLCVGFEVSTSTHAFHIYLASASNILPQESIMWNQNHFFNKGILLGLNITRLWNF